MENRLTEAQLAQRMAVPEVDPDPFVRMFRSTCGECGGPIRWVDPAALARLDRESYLRYKKYHGAQALLDGDLWLCLQCENTGLMGERGDWEGGEDDIAF